MSPPILHWRAELKPLMGLDAFLRCVSDSVVVSNDRTTLFFSCLCILLVALENDGLSLIWTILLGFWKWCALWVDLFSAVAYMYSVKFSLMA